MMTAEERRWYIDRINQEHEKQNKNAKSSSKPNKEYYGPASGF